MKLVRERQSPFTATSGGTSVISYSTIAYNAGTAYNTAGGSIFVYATATGTTPAGTNRVHDNGATGTPTSYILMQ